MGAGVKKNSLVILNNFGSPYFAKISFSPYPTDTQKDRKNILTKKKYLDKIYKNDEYYIKKIKIEKLSSLRSISTFQFQNFLLHKHYWNKKHICRTATFQSKKSSEIY